MVQRSLLTPELLRNLDCPLGKEYWIADTKVPGFGVRVWDRAGCTKFSYAVRKSDQTGRSVRRTFGPSSLPISQASEIRSRARDATVLIQRDLPLLLPKARKWARLEIAKISGRVESDDVLHRARETDAANRKRVGKYLQTLSLEHCVEQVLRHGKHRDWTEEYRDRLRSAYYTFDRVTACGQLTTGQLSGGALVKIIEEAQVGNGTRRLLRSLLKVVAENVHAVGGLQGNHMLVKNLQFNVSQNKQAKTPWGETKPVNHQRLIQIIRESRISWQSKGNIELAFRFNVPFSQILRGKWSQVKGDRWYPLGFYATKYGYTCFEMIESGTSECINFVRSEARRRNISSDYWFPSDSLNGRPIQNVGRAWQRVLEENQWPQMPLRAARRYFK